ncbi:MAG TPA: hypothetical protein VIU64_08140 [Polyangia bacterium]
MRLTRILDILVLLLLATLVVMPRPDATVKAALPLVPERRERAAELQAHLLGSPDDVPASLELADLFLDGHRPDWTLATVGHLMPAHADDFRLHLRRAVAYADRFESAPAFAAATRSWELCNGPPVTGVPPCDDAIRSRIALLRDTLERVKGIDMRNNPALAKDKIFEGLHPVWLMKKAPSAKPPAGKPAPTPPPPVK